MKEFSRGQNDFVKRSDTMTNRRLIGGEFELRELRFDGHDRLTNLTFGLPGTWTASGRAALALVLRNLQTNGVRHVHLPAYLCQSILLPIKELGLEYSFYEVDNTLAAHPDPPNGSAVLLIHYFGWNNPATERLRAEAGKAFYLIEDASQALLSDLAFTPSDSKFIFLSPRKFGPTPLGGWCDIQAATEKSSIEVEAMFWLSLAARLARGAYMAESYAPIDPKIETFYLEAFNKVEKFLDSHPTATYLPRIVLDIIAGIDWENIANQRRVNWQILNELLGNDVEPLMPDLPADVVPLGYVIRIPERDRLKVLLSKHRLFCPVHWLLPHEVNTRQFPDAALISETCLTLPIDQRYSSDDMAKMAQTLKTLL